MGGEANRKGTQRKTNLDRGTGRRTDTLAMQRPEVVGQGDMRPRKNRAKRRRKNKIICHDDAIVVCRPHTKSHVSCRHGNVLNLCHAIPDYVSLNGNRSSDVGGLVRSVTFTWYCFVGRFVFESIVREQSITHEQRDYEILRRLLKINPANHNTFVACINAVQETPQDVFLCVILSTVK